MGGDWSRVDPLIDITALSSRFGCYVFENAAAQAPTRFAALAEILDPGTIRHLTNLGVVAGWECLEVGGGGGSIAGWLSLRVGDAGRVVATDIDTRFLNALGRPNLEVRQHDIVSDPLPEAAFDLVHARLVLHHLPEREAALERMVTALKPGGWLLAEEFDALSMPADPGISEGEVLLKSTSTLRRLMSARGVDLRYGRVLPSRLGAHGLLNIEAEGRVFMWHGASTGACLLAANLEQLREAMTDGKLVSAGEIAEDLARLRDPHFMAPSPVLWAAWGRRPSE